MVYGRETGASGTPHLQGFTQLSKQTSFSVVKRHLPGAHIEKRKGTPLQAADYCKKDGDFTEIGELPKQGKRNDLKAMQEAIKAGMSEVDLYEEHTGPMFKHYRAAARYRTALNRADRAFTINMEVMVLWGKAGCGKTRRAHELDPDLYFVSHGGDRLWWDGYDGQHTILFDDFYGGVKHSMLLRLIDGYRFHVPIKGGFTWKAWKRVIFTSNTPPGEWYTKGGNELDPALARRITSITAMSGGIDDGVEDHSAPVVEGMAWAS